MAVTSRAETSAPLLLPREGGVEVGTRPASLALLLGRAAGRRGPSMLVRETAARQLEERRADWGYSKPVVALDMMWNMAFVAVSVVTLIFTGRERPNMPIRVWICGYALQCGFHAMLVWLEYRRRRRGAGNEERGSDSDDSEDEGGSSLFKRCESMNTMVSFLWWIVGFYWVVSGGERLLQNAPHLYWLAVVFLAFDVFFAIFCVVLACVIGIALCCCLPCIIALLYAVADQEGASEADVSMLPRYRFYAPISESVGAGRMVPAETSSGYLANERVLLHEDAECCICLSPYEDGAALHALPCSHHFHSACIGKWLKMNATCPLCKFNIIKGNDQV